MFLGPDSVPFHTVLSTVSRLLFQHASHRFYSFYKLFLTCFRGQWVYSWEDRWTGFVGRNESELADLSCIVSFSQIYISAFSTKAVECDTSTGWLWLNSIFLPKWLLNSVEFSEDFQKMKQILSACQSIVTFLWFPSLRPLWRQLEFCVWLSDWMGREDRRTDRASFRQTDSRKCYYMHSTCWPSFTFMSHLKIVESPPVIAHGRHKIVSKGSWYQHEEVEYECDEGYILDGAKDSCTSSGLVCSPSV